MAYRRFRRRGSFRRSRSYGWRRFNRGGFGMGGGLMFTAAGAAAGYMAPRVVPYQDLAITALAVLPVKIPRTVRKLASGYVLGMLIKGFMAPTAPGGISQSDFA